MKDQELNVYEIPIEGLPEGWEIKTIRILHGLGSHPKGTYMAQVIIKPTKPREITLVEVEQGKHTVAFVDDANMWTYWRIKEE